MTTLGERIAGGLWGLLVGDALGVPYEFHAPEALPPRADLEMVPPAGFRRAHASVPPGTWSDDGAQALCLLASLLERRRFVPEDFARRLVAWRREGYMAVDGRVFDVGIQTDAVLAKLAAGVPPSEAAPRDERSNGNGSLMRVLPLALWHRGGDAELVRDAHAQSRVTHAHVRSEVLSPFTASGRGRSWKASRTPGEPRCSGSRPSTAPGRTLTPRSWSR